MNADLMQRAEEIMKKANTAVIATIDGEGYPRASVITSLKTEGIKHAWFSTSLKSGKVRCIRINSKASLCYSDGDNNITLMGTIEIVTDPELKKDMWLDWFIDHFPGGIEDPNYCLLKFTAGKAAFWIDSISLELDEIA